MTGGAGPEPVLVVGAGPTGLALAGQLRLFGVPVRVVEQRTAPQPSRAFIVQPRTLEVLAPSGLADRLVARGATSARIRLIAGRRRAEVRLDRPGVVDTPYPFLLAVPQAEVEAVLADRLAELGVPVEWGVRLTGLRPAGGGVEVELQHPGGRAEVVRAPWVVGCDGRDSAVRGAAGIRFPARTYRPRLLLADVELTGDVEAGAVHGLIERTGAVFLFPFPDGLTWRLLTVLEPADRGRDPADLAAEVTARASGGRIQAAQVAWAAPFELRRAQADRYRQGRVLLAGDAAHVHSPAGAQGMNTGLQDAVNLGWKLALVASGTAGPGLLDTYQAERWPVARWTRRLTDLAFLAEAGGGSVLAWARRRLAPPAVPLASGRTMPRPLFRLLGGLQTRYRADPAAPRWGPFPTGPPQPGPRQPGEPRRGPARGPGPGHRLPDGLIVRSSGPIVGSDALAAGTGGPVVGPSGPVAGPDARVAGPDGPVVGPGGGGLRLHELLRQPGFHLLALDTAGPAADPPSLPEIPGLGTVPVHGHRLTVEPALARRLHLTGPTFLLVRPDGYLGGRWPGPDPAPVLAALDRYRRVDGNGNGPGRARPAATGGGRFQRRLPGTKPPST